MIILLSLPKAISCSFKCTNTAIMKEGCTLILLTWFEATWLLLLRLFVESGNTLALLPFGVEPFL